MSEGAPPSLSDATPLRFKRFRWWMPPLVAGATLVAELALLGGVAGGRPYRLRSAVLTALCTPALLILARIAVTHARDTAHLWRYAKSATAYPGGPGVLVSLLIFAPGWIAARFREVHARRP